MTTDDYSKRHRSDADDPMEPSNSPTPGDDAARDELALLEAWLAEFDTPAPSESTLVAIKRRVEFELDSEWLATAAADPVVDDVTRARVKLAVRRRLQDTPAPE